MEKQKKWQFYLIVAVILLTIYNILPTIFYYSKPLKEPINEKRANQVAEIIVKRVNKLEQDTVKWLQSFCKMLGIKPLSIEFNPNDPGLIKVKLQNEKDVAVFKKYLPDAGALVPIAPAQLKLMNGSRADEPNTVIVKREVSIPLNTEGTNEFFKFAKKYDDKGQVSNVYKEIVYDRVNQLAKDIGDQSTYQTLVSGAMSSNENQSEESLLRLANEIVEVNKSLGIDHPVTKRIYSIIGNSLPKNKKEFAKTLIAKNDQLKTNISSTLLRLNGEQKKLIEEGKVASATIDEQIHFLQENKKSLEAANAILKDKAALFSGSTSPIDLSNVEKEFNTGFEALSLKNPVQTINLNNSNPLIKELVVDWGNDKIIFELHDDVQKLLESKTGTEEIAYARSKLSQFIINEVARISRQSDEKLNPQGDTFSISLSKLQNAKSFLVLDLSAVAKEKSDQLYQNINTHWNPQHTDLVRDQFPVYDWNTYRNLPAEEKKLGLIVLAPAAASSEVPKGFHNGSIYVIGKGLQTILQKYRTAPNAEENQSLINDIAQLESLLIQDGFISYPGDMFGIDPTFKNDMIFELDDYYSSLISATREDFTIHGSKKLAILDFSDVEQRILTENKIDDQIQDELVKWEDEYNSAQVSSDPLMKFKVPPPIYNSYWTNFLLSFKKYFRGDERKILKWGLDLSGGKTVRIGLLDANNRRVTNPDDLKQAVNELYTRINKLGVSERTIRIESENIILEFPGSQGLSAEELIQASTMYFHIVNEKFSPQNPNLRDAITQFLQNVWNEAVVTNRKDIKSINRIAWEHLGAEVEGVETKPRSEAAKKLAENGLVIANPDNTQIGPEFNDVISSIAMYRDGDFKNWDGQTNPLVIVFHNFALEGSSLTNIRTSFDASHGNTLSFEIKKSYEGSQSKGTGSPRDDFYEWTSQFAKDKIVGTPKEAYSRGQGWRMAVLLNDQIVSSPTLNAALRDNGQITGKFTPREINLLASDLKAGSLSFKPYILSEQNVSPELGKEERNGGIIASIIALVLVVAAMVGYYHFAGVVASCAVLFNLLIMWGALQNLGAALTLPGIAGIVLTIGMAVDANVLVFERIREEFSISGRIASAIQAGYKKAFSAIVDSNITTIIAALILLQFDSGPIKGFAVTLIIGIVSSMFTALFMTRYFFSGWVQNPNNKQLTMEKFINETNFDFLGKAKIALISSLAIMLVGSALFFAQRNTLFGMDFTGGYSLQTELVERSEPTNYRVLAADALIAKGASVKDFEVRELNKPNNLRIQFGMSMEEPGHPFHGMPQFITEENLQYKYQSNPRILWTLQALSDAGLNVQENELASVDKNWSAMSGQLSESMRNNALYGLGIAMLCILIYITLRFEFNYAVAAVIALAHDVILTLGILAIFHKFGFPVQIDLQVIGAIMTIIGYSLNDTIIIFDRIREDLKVHRKMTFSQVINHAINVTLGRTIMTSGTTLLVLITLVLLGGQSIFSFSLIMTLGVLIGTFSSLFIAGPCLLYLHNKEGQHQKLIPKNS